MNGRQHGVALLSVLLVMSLALLLVAGMLRSHHLLLQGSARQVHQLQLRQHALSAEAWALLALEDTESVVHSGQAWAQVTWPFDSDAALINIGIEDLSARFNLNTLLGNGQVDQVSEQRWQRLLKALGVQPIDLHGAGERQELSQLRLVPGIDGAILHRLEPWVAVLPREATLNINTASAQVLAMLDGMSLATAEAVVNQRPATVYDSAQGFTHDPLVAGLGINGHGLGVGSRWFRISVDVSLGSSHLRLVSDIERERKTGRLRVVQRRLVPPLLPVEIAL